MTPDKLPALAANPAPNARQASLLQEALSALEDPRALADRLPPHRIGPLLHWQINHYGLAAPSELRTALAAQALASRRQSARTTGVAAAITQCLAQAGIESVVLKGAALAHLAYAEPWLRPMDDVDVLVPERAMPAVQAALESIGLILRPPRTRAERRNHHWPVAALDWQGRAVFVEVHLRVLNTRLGQPMPIDRLMRPLWGLQTPEGRLHALHPEDFIATQITRFRHLTEILRAIALADVVGLAETQREHIDWQRLRRRVPGLREVFSALQAATPLSPPLCEALGLDPQAASGRINLATAGYEGWPVNAHLKRRVGRPAPRRLLRDTLRPNAWWARLAYGRSPRGGGRLCMLCLDHPRNLLAQSLRRLYHDGL
ncbi:nucleotidyltransferase family protein [Spiribacter roseus]|uniref:nucleotidyltransferase family protein n=1 Tax=Spiribacter roseus TaxID=1855875 RepID=UPI001F1C318F|nr:nucleotidyltransferase family protein [Spiribacter roseus]